MNCLVVEDVIFYVSEKEQTRNRSELNLLQIPKVKVPPNVLPFGDKVSIGKVKDDGHVTIIDANNMNEIVNATVNLVIKVAENHREITNQRKHQIGEKIQIRSRKENQKETQNRKGKDQETKKSQVQNNNLEDVKEQKDQDREKHVKDRDRDRDREKHVEDRDLVQEGCGTGHYRGIFMNIYIAEHVINAIVNRVRLRYSI